MAAELPKLSALTQALAAPEAQIESLIRGSLGIELPPGPMSVLLKIQTAIESGKPPTPEVVVPGVTDVLSRLPTLPRLEEIIPTVAAPQVAPAAPAPSVPKEARIY